jgi:hypothetical protein
MSEAAPNSTDQTTPDAPRTVASSWMALFVAGVLAAGAAAALFQTTSGKFDAPVPDVIAASDKMILEFQKKQDEGFLASNAFTGALVGFVIVGLFAAAEGLSRKSLTKVLIGLVAAVMVGGAFQAAAGMGVYRFYRHCVSVSLSGEVRSVGMQAIFWLPLALALCIAMSAAGRGLRALPRLLPPVLVAAGLAAVLIPLTGMTLFPLSYSDRIPPPSLQQLLFNLTVGSLCLAAGLARCRRV